MACSSVPEGPLEKPGLYQGPQGKHRFIIWLTILGRLPNANRLLKWHI